MFGAKEARRGQHRLVAGLFDNDLVARRDQRRHGEEIGHRRAVGSDDHIGADAIALGDRLSQRRVTRVAGAIEVEVGRWLAAS